MTSRQQCALAKKYLLELLKLTSMVEDDEKPGQYIEVPQFSESGTYPIFGKDRARTVRAIMQKLAAALGVKDIDRLGRQKVPSDKRTWIWELLDAVRDAESAARRLEWEIREMEKAEDFVDAVLKSRNEVEQVLQTEEFSKPETVLKRIKRAIGVDERGRIMPKWERDEKRKEE
jgi:hypothetical protein